jgi:ribosome-associated protein
VSARLQRLAGKRLTREGVIVITAQRHRTQERNRQDARDRLIELIRQAAVVPVKRRPTRPTKASRQRRLDSKKLRARTKGLRQTRPPID